MKLFVIAAALLFSANVVKAQGAGPQNGTDVAYQFALVKGDTATTTDTVFKAFELTAGYSTVCIQATELKITGTPAGKVLLYQSQDGVNYVETDSVSLATPITTSVTPPSANLTGMIFKTPNAGAVYYIVAVTNTAGSSSGVVTVYFTKRQNLTALTAD